MTALTAPRLLRSGPLVYSIVMPSAWSPLFALMAMLGGIAEAAPGQDERLFVQASTLRLRAGPSPKARPLARLRINAPLTKLSARGDFTEVRVANGKVGWVASAFLATTPITKAAALEGAEAAKTPADRLSWLQRAAAVAPSDTAVLERLQKAYLAAKKPEAAALVARNIWRLTARMWPNRYLVPGPAVIELEAYGIEAEHTETPIPREKWAAKGLSPDARLWILPDRGPAVPAKVTKLEVVLVNECGAQYALAATVEPEASLGDAVPVMVAEGERPKGWGADAPAPKPDPKAEVAARRLVSRLRKPKLKADRARVKKAPTEEEAAFFRKTSDEQPVGISEVSSVEVTGGALVFVIELLPMDYDGLLQPRRVWPVFVPRGGPARVLWSPGGTSGFSMAPRAHRDLDGDGAPETVVDVLGCSTDVLDGDGAVLFVTGARCCE